MQDSSSLSTRPLIVILLGPPGTGKGTQAKLLEKQLSIPHISTGDLFRGHMQKQTALGIQAKAYIDAGLLVPDELVLNMLVERVEEADCRRGYILDGFPRTIPQAEALQSFLIGKCVTPFILNLSLSDALIIQRLSNRLTCQSCGSPYHKIFSPPTLEGRCNRCGGQLIQRPDDSEEVIRTRLQVYHNQTKPLIAFYTKNHTLHSIDCNADQQTVFKQILQLIPAHTKQE